MAKLIIECTVDRSKRPSWMNRLISFLSSAQRRTYVGTSDEMVGIYGGVESYLRQMNLSGQAGVTLDAELTKDGDIHIKKNGRTFAEMSFEE